MQQTLFERILAKTVGVEMSSEELELVAGGRRQPCEPAEAYDTFTGHSHYCDAY